MRQQINGVKYVLKRIQDTALWWLGRGDPEARMMVGILVWVFGYIFVIILSARFPQYALAAAALWTIVALWVVLGAAGELYDKKSSGSR